MSFGSRNRGSIVPLKSFVFYVSFQHRFNSNTSGPVKADQTEVGTSKESIAQTTAQPTAPTMPPTTMAPTPQPSTPPEADKVVVNKSESVNPWQQLPEKESIEEEGRKPDMKPFRDEVEQDAVVAENEADKAALLNEVPGGKANKTEGVVGEDSDDAISEEIPSQSEVLNVSPVRPRPRLVTPFRGRCPVCRKYFVRSVLSRERTTRF